MDGITLDHVAVALERWADGWPRFCVELGGRWKSGGAGPGFAPSQYVFANEMRLELLAPNQIEVNDFLRRFLDHSGPGPHHFTFKVDDIEQALTEVEAHGLRPVGVDLRDPEWKEAFLHPKDSELGILVQLAEAAGPAWRNAPPDGYPAPEHHAPPAALVRVTHCVADLGRALAQFRDLLGGREVARADDEAATWVELAWPGPGRIRLCRPRGDRGPLVDWLGGRPGRVHHLAFAGADPERVTGAVRLANGGAFAEPDPATGTRVLLLPEGAEQQ